MAQARILSDLNLAAAAKADVRAYIEKIKADVEKLMTEYQEDKESLLAKPIANAPAQPIIHAALLRLTASIAVLENMLKEGRSLNSIDDAYNRIAENEYAVAKSYLPTAMHRIAMHDLAGFHTGLIGHAAAKVADNPVLKALYLSVKELINTSINTIKNDMAAYEKVGKPASLACFDLFYPAKDRLTFVQRDLMLLWDIQIDRENAANGIQPQGASISTTKDLNDSPNSNSNNSARSSSASARVSDLSFINNKPNNPIKNAQSNQENEKRDCCSIM